ncbi:YHYH protein [Undibacterium sp. TS12]|uniref:YHYH protein n=1 Tax=Undibacterium sp. TS12 TaxID=2908202 RepID=UPI001F4D01E2|nr:YHYH protein [Undibacterium sp. TS12]MCH8620374.1 YHYH protein [Undibacterium sp. TS12]
MKQKKLIAVMAVSLSVGLLACGGGSGSTAAVNAATTTGASTGTTTGTTTGTSTGTGSTSGSTSGSSTGSTTSTATVDASKLPLGDGKFTRTAPAVGYVYACYSAGSGGASSKGPWFNADGSTWNSLSKISVQGAVKWTSSFIVTLGTTLGITGNGLPSTPTGNFPIASTDPAYAYDRNPNAIAQSNIAWGLPGNPVVADKPSCTSLGAIGVLLDGARLFNADDGGYRDAVAWEVQDACQGHPERTGQYHHHNISTCLAQKDTTGQHSPLLGYIADGFGIYGNLGENGKALTNADLDECHGHSHAIVVNGVSVNQYHYHQTKEFPYTVGCFKGTPVTIH